jgi:hypothetical protein
VFKLTDMADGSPHLISVGQFLYDAMGLRFALWLALAGACTWVAWTWSLSLPATVEILASKFTLIGFAAAIASFHYAEWRRTTREALDRVYDPEWSAREGRLSVLREEIERGAEAMTFEYLQLETRIRGWYERRLARIQLLLRNELPSARVVLTDLMSGSYFLVVSSIADIAGLMFDPQGGSWRWFSLGTFAGSFSPFLSALFSHIGRLKGDFTSWESIFKEIEGETRAKLRTLTRASKEGEGDGGPTH